MSSPLHDWMRWEPVRAARFGSLVLTPARVAVGAGAAVTIVGAFMPWAEGTVPGRQGFERAFFSGLGGAGDGLMLAILAALTAVLVVHRTPATSRIRLVHLLPYLLIVLAALTWVTGYRAALAEVAAWERRGGSGALAPGLWIAAAGIVTMAAGAIALVPSLLRWQRAQDDPADLMAVSRRGIAEVAAGIAGVVVGGWLGIGIGVSLTPVPVIGLIALGAVTGGLLGAYAGTWIARAIADGLRQGDR